MEGGGGSILVYLGQGREHFQVLFWAKNRPKCCFQKHFFCIILVAKGSGTLKTQNWSGGPPSPQRNPFWPILWAFLGQFGINKTHFSQKEFVPNDIFLGSQITFHRVQSGFCAQNDKMYTIAPIERPRGGSEIARGGPKMAAKTLLG